MTEELRQPDYGRSEAAQGYRNGITAEGLVEYAVPQVTGTETPWHSEVREALAGRTGELERLAIKRYARGLSMRDIERTFMDATGHCVLTKTAASEVAECLWEDYQASPPVISRPPTCCISSSTESMNGCIWANHARRCSAPGGSPPPVQKSCWS